MDEDPGPLRRIPIRRDPVSVRAPRSRRGLRLTPGRLVVIVALVGGAALVGYGLIRRDATQIPILAAGLIVVGLTLVGAGFWSAYAAYRSARIGRSGAAFGGSLLGGISVLAGSAALAVALVLSLIWRSA